MRSMTSVVWLALCGVVIGLTACSTEEKQPSPDSDDYFPLAVGDWWVYEETDDDPDTAWTTRQVRLEVVDSVEMDFELDAEGALPVLVVEETYPSGDDLADPRVAYDYDDGAVVVRKRQEILDAATDAPKRTVDYEPGLLRFDRGRTAAGDEWDGDYMEVTVSVPTQPEDGEWLLEYLYEIQEPETVTVPAGTFDCLVLKRTCQSGYPGEDEVAPEVSVFYFATGVGMVKAVTGLGGGVTTVEELVELHVAAPDGGA